MFLKGSRAIMHKFIFHNDRVLPVELARLSPGQAGLLNGWGLFTTFRTFNGIPFAFERHWNRLARDAERIQLPLPFDQRTVRGFVGEVIRINHVQTGCVRIYFVKNKVGIWCSDETFPEVDLIICSADLPERPQAARLCVTAHARHATNPLTGVKVTAWLNNTWNLEQAHRQGCEDAILLNENGDVVECTATNIFCVRGESVITPPQSSGCLLGVTREILLEILPGKGINLAESRLTLAELQSSDEVFITSTTRNIQPVSCVSGKNIPQAPGPMTEKLSKIFSAYIKDYIERAGRATAGP